MSTIPQATDAPTPLLRHVHVQRTFRMGEVAVDVSKHISLEIFAGELLAIVGFADDAVAQLRQLDVGLG